MEYLLCLMRSFEFRITHHLLAQIVKLFAKLLNEKISNCIVPSESFSVQLNGKQYLMLLRIGSSIKDIDWVWVWVLV